MMGWYGGSMDAADWVAMSVMMIVFWGGLAALVVWVVRSLRPAAADTPARTDADALLAERFARGELDSEEFARSRELLHSGVPGGNRQ